MKDARSVKEFAPASTPGSTADAPAAPDYVLPESWQSMDEVEDGQPATEVVATDSLESREPRGSRDSGESREPRESRETRSVLSTPASSSTTARTALSAALYFLVTAVVAGGAFYAGRSSRPPAPAVVPPAAPALTITSARDGDTVTVNGRDVGVTPYRLVVDNTVQDLRIVTPEPVAPAATTAAAPVTPSQTDTLSPSRPRSGGLRLSAPIEVQVLEGERVLGSSAEGPIVASAGLHQLDFVNSALGYREHRAVDFRAGQVVGLTLTPPNGRLNINAVPWAQVSIDGREVGETPLANVSISTGQHEIVFRHPQFGERKEVTLVKAGAMTRLSVTMSRPTP